MFKADRPARELVGEQIAEHGSEAALRLAGDRSREAGAALELRAAEAGQPVVELRADVGQRLVAEVADVDVARLERLARLQEVGAHLQRVADGRVDVSTALGWNAGSSDGTIRVVQKSGDDWLKTSARRLSWAFSICACATITACSRAATSACASTASIGGVVPIWMRAFVSRSDSLARSSDCCWTTSEAFAYARSQYALRTARDVVAIVCWSWKSEISRFFSLRITCWRSASMLKFRSSGCRMSSDSDDCSCGEKFEKRFVVVERVLSQPTL